MIQLNDIILVFSIKINLQLQADVFVLNTNIA